MLVTNAATNEDVKNVEMCLDLRDSELPKIILQKGTFKQCPFLPSTDAFPDYHNDLQRTTLWYDY